MTTAAPRETASPEPAPDDLRTQVVRSAVELFEHQGFEATSVADLAAAVGISRATFFRQIGTKEDAVFADHAPLLEHLSARMQVRLERPGAQAHEVVCEASLQVLAYLSADLPAARRRYRVVRAVPALRDREIVTERRYERLFVETLRAHLPAPDPLGTVVFAAALTAAHNHALRSLLRGDRDDDGAALSAADELRGALEELRTRLTGQPGAPGAGGSGPSSSDGGVTVVVAAAPSSATPEEIAAKVRDALV